MLYFTHYRTLDIILVSCPAARSSTLQGSLVAGLPRLQYKESGYTWFRLAEKPLAHHRKLLTHLDLTVVFAIKKQFDMSFQVQFGCSAVLKTYPSMLITGCEESLCICKETKSAFSFLEDGMGGEVQEQGIFKEYFLLYSSTQKQKLPAQPVKHTSSI